MGRLRKIKPETDHNEMALADADTADRLAGIFNRLARQLREARLLRRENDVLREENAQLRNALAGCVDACGQFLAPALGAQGLSEDEEQNRAWQALEEGRRLLKRPPRLPGPDTES